MKIFKYLVAVLILMCCMPLASCTGEAEVKISSRYDHVNWWLSKKTVDVGDEVKLAVSIDDDYDGDTDVYLNGNLLELKGGYYTFTAQKTNKIEIDGDVYRSIQRVEFPHKVLLAGQDFTTINDRITVYYKNGDVESIDHYEVDNYFATLGDQKIIMTFIGGDHEYKRIVDVKVVDKVEYLEYVKSSFTAAIQRDEIDSMLASNRDCTVYQNDEILVYEDIVQKVWILNGGMSYITLKESGRNLSHKFVNSVEALNELQSYMPRLQFEMKMNVRSTYENLICSIKAANISVDEANIVLSFTIEDDYKNEIVCEYVLDSSLSYIISISRGDNATSINTNTEYNTELPDNVDWTELLDVNDG